MDYYDGTKLLSMVDINNQPPGLYLTTSNRSAGKTTFFNRYCVKKFIKNKEKFMVLFRYKYELFDVAEKFFSEIKNLFFPNLEMTSKMQAKGLYAELYLNEISCGYAVALNSSDMLRKNSHLFADTQRILFDEFQAESNVYLSNEINKFLSLYTSVARGGGKQSRNVPVYMLSNNVNVLNPYFVELGISERLKSNTKYLRGNGFVLELGFNQAASIALKSNNVLKAFQTAYNDYASNGTFLYDDTAFIEKINGTNRYIATLKFDGEFYAIREYPQHNIVYCDDRIDDTFNYRVAVTTDDHQAGFVRANSNDFMVKCFRDYFNYGNFRFKNIKCKKAILNYLKY